MYLSGFGNHHQTEALPGALPQQQNSPQQIDYGLYAEQLSGSAFTCSRYNNFRSWLYRKLPSVAVNDYSLANFQITSEFSAPQSPNPLRWSALKAPNDEQDFLTGLFHIAGSNNVNAYLYNCNTSMSSFFKNQDGELLIVPHLGEIQLETEFGNLTIQPGWLAVIPRGIFFRVELSDQAAAGYICENSGHPLQLPQLGPIGANGLANPRHFLYPSAAISDNNNLVNLYSKYQGSIWMSEHNQSPCNVAAWHGNYAPYIYDLSLFNTINSVSFDHPDPSIFTVLTSPSTTADVANLDFVIFPPRWMVAENTFRPPYFHRNIMNELMGLIKGQYDAKGQGFDIGGISIHNCMTPHGPDVDSTLTAQTSELKPQRYRNTLAFMFETCDSWLYTTKAWNCPTRQADYTSCWRGFASKN